MRRSLPALVAVGNSLWNAALSLLAVRVYLGKLGVEAYGVIGFYLSLQAVLQILDVGLAPAINRELARARALGAIEQGRTLLRTLARIYWIVGAIIAGMIGLLASPIATHWLNPGHLGTGEITKAVALVGLVIAARWPVAVYHNALIGLGHLGQASALNGIMTTANLLLSVATITWIQTSLDALFIAQAIMALIYALAIRRLAWRNMGGKGAAAVDIAAVRPIWKFSLGMGGVALTSVALTQLDKVLLSRLLPLQEFGEYMVAATLTAGLTLLITPLFGIIFPRFSALVAGERSSELKDLYWNGSRLFAVLYLPIVAAIGIYARDFVWVWTGQQDMATRTAPLIFLLAIGYGINGLMYFPYTLQLAMGLSQIPLRINTMLLVLMAPLIVFLTLTYGAIGGAAAWPILQLLYLFAGTAFTHRSAAIGRASVWVFGNVALPGATSIVVMLAARPLIYLAPEGSIIRLVWVGGSVIAAWMISLIIFPSARAEILRHFRPSKAALT